MEIVRGKIVEWREDGTVLICATLPNMDTAIKRQYGEAVIGLDDGRRISPEQRRKVYALINEISDWMGEFPENVKAFFKMNFIVERLQSIERKMFSLSDVDMTTARMFISYLIEFIVTHGVPSRIPLWELAEDSGDYLYLCLLNRKCCVCGREANLHHCDRIGMGNDRKEVVHIGRECLPLCPEHHDEIHRAPEAEFYEKYHLLPVKIDDDVAKKYKLNRRRK